MATILLDKSAFQDLTLDELKRSRRRYQMLATDVLLLEILGDLRYGDNRTTTFSRKLRASHLYVNTPYHLLCGKELLGARVPMDRVPVLEAHEVQDSSGNRGAYIPPSEGDASLLRWAGGDFDEQDLEHARVWADAVNNFPIEDLERGVRLGLSKEHRPASIADIASAVDYTLRGEFQDALLDVMLAYLFLPDEWVAPIRRRWSRGDLRLLEDAPYTAFCARVIFIFIGAVGGQMVGTRKSNFVDAQYLMYLPFCDMFASGDKVHQTLFPFVSLPGQQILSSRELKGQFDEVTSSAPNPYEAPARQGVDAP